MKLSNFTLSGWRAALNVARNTVNLPPLDKEPSDDFKIKLIRSEHSPLREIKLSWRWTDIKYWVAMHLVRHNIGVDGKYISTQRVDRTGKERGSQDAPVNFDWSCNAQAMINISKVRLCFKASPATRAAWRKAVDQTDDNLKSACVPSCIYRGFCPEDEPCTYHGTEAQKNDRIKYLKHLRAYDRNIRV